jgi:uncharacterized Rmd1/YagE family protein
MDEPVAVVARALFVGQRIDVRGLERVASNPTIVHVEGGGRAAVFRYGAVVLFDVAKSDGERFVAALRPLVTRPYDQPERESIEVIIDPRGREGLVGGTLTLLDGSTERLQIVAEILAKSVVLAQYEDEVAAAFNAVEPLAAELHGGRNRRRRAREILSHIGSTLLIQHKMVGRVEVSEKPELLWEHPELEGLYLRLEDEYELRERHQALERKLELIHTTATTALELLHVRRSLRVEWYIVLLIVAEIGLTLYELFGRSP